MASSAAPSPNSRYACPTTSTALHVLCACATFCDDIYSYVMQEVLPSARGIPSQLVQVVECAYGAGMVSSACMNGVSESPKNEVVPELCGGTNATASRRPERMGAEVAGSMHANASHHRSVVDCHVPSTRQGSDGCWPRQISCEGCESSLAAMLWSCCVAQHMYVAQSPVK